MSDLSTCPFCGCGVKSWLNIEHTRCDWLCGSFKHGPEPYQFPDGACRGNELELELDGWKAAHLDMSGDMLKVEADNAALLSRLEHQRAALLTPEGYRGVVAEALADEHERLVGENASLRTIVAAYDPLDVLLAAKALADVAVARFEHMAACDDCYHQVMPCDEGLANDKRHVAAFNAYLKAKKGANTDGS